MSLWKEYLSGLVLEAWHYGGGQWAKAICRMIYLGLNPLKKNYLIHAASLALIAAILKPAFTIIWQP